MTQVLLTNVNFKGYTSNHTMNIILETSYEDLKHYQNEDQNILQMQILKKTKLGTMIYEIEDLIRIKTGCREYTVEASMIKKAFLKS